MNNPFMMRVILGGAKLCDELAISRKLDLSLAINTFEGKPRVPFIPRMLCV
jgi:hypothetical protein